MTDVMKLQYHYHDYEFVVTDLNLFDPDGGPCIAMKRLEDGLIIGYSNFGKFVGTKPGDETHRERLETAARMLSHFLMNMDRYGLVRLSDIDASKVNEYIFIMCTPQESVYARDFVVNLASAGYMTFINPEDIIIFSTEVS